MAGTCCNSSVVPAGGETVRGSTGGVGDLVDTGVVVLWGTYRVGDLWATPLGSLRGGDAICGSSGGVGDRLATSA